MVTDATNLKNGVNCYKCSSVCTLTESFLPELDCKTVKQSQIPGQLLGMHLTDILKLRNTGVQ